MGRLKTQTVTLSRSDFKDNERLWLAIYDLADADPNRDDVEITEAVATV